MFWANTSTMRKRVNQQEHCEFTLSCFELVKCSALHRKTMSRRCTPGNRLCQSDHSVVLPGRIKTAEVRMLRLLDCVAAVCYLISVPKRWRYYNLRCKWQRSWKRKPPQWLRRTTPIPGTSSTVCNNSSWRSCRRNSSWRPSRLGWLGAMELAA
jgi:hypothetical protein